MTHTATPNVNSLWRDAEQQITYQVKGIGADYELVNCQHGTRRWTDGMPLECFGTDLQPIN
jgi:predicted lipoprotein with Yx(FWY)xxD motif